MNIWTISTFLLLTGLVAAISWWFTRKEDLSTKEGFFLGGRSLSGISIGFSILLTNWSAEQLIGLNGQGYSVGLSSMGWAVTAALAFIIMAVFVLPYFIKKGITTIPDLIEERFGANSRNVIAWLFIINTAFVFLPTILYAGALGMSKIFDVSGLLGLSESQGLVVSILFITIVGGIYAIFGGLKAVVISDTVNGIGFFIGSILVLVLALSVLGQGSPGYGVMELLSENKEMLNAVSSPNVNVPFGAIFTGMLLINIYFSCTNQVIIQRALGAKSVAEGQKGVLIAALVKIISILILIVPGIIAFHLYGGNSIDPDEAYPLLVKEILPAPLVGLFGAILFGAIISTFNSTINSCSTVFSNNIYYPYKKKAATGYQCIQAGKIFGTGLALFAALCAPFVKQAPQGLYMFMHEFNSLFTIPMLMMIVTGIFSKTATAKTTLPGMATYILLYITFKFIYTGWDLYFLHKIAIYFICGLMVIAWCTYYSKEPLKINPILHNTPSIDMDNWKYLRISSISVFCIMVATYALASPIGLVASRDDIPKNILNILIVTMASIFLMNEIFKRGAKYFSQKRLLPKSIDQ